MSHYQHRFGFRARSDWGDGDELSELAEGDIVHVPADCPAVTEGRLPHGWSHDPDAWSLPGNCRVVCVFSIGEDAAWYYRVAPMHGRVTVWSEHSDRLHVIPGQCDFTEGFTLVQAANDADSRPPVSPTARSGR